MRVFIALNLPLEVKDYLFLLQSSFKSSNAKINFVAKKNLHQTLKFFGDINETKLETLQENLSNIHFNKFYVELSSFMVFPNVGLPKVLWVGLEPENTIINLQKLIDQFTLTIGKKDTKFGAHLTLGRIKLIKDKDKFFKDICDVKLKPLRFPVEKFSLIKSELTKNGPIYSNIQDYYLE